MSMKRIWVSMKEFSYLSRNIDYVEYKCGTCLPTRKQLLTEHP